MEENFGVAVIVLSENSEVLIGKRKYSYKSGYWGIPGGRADTQEKLIDAAKRELLEETGLEANGLEYIGVVREWQESCTFIHFIYVCKDWQGEVELREPDKCEGWEWMQIDSFPGKTLPGHKKALQMFKNKQEIWDI